MRQFSSLHVADKLAAMGPLWLFQWAAWLTTPDNLSAEEVLKQSSDMPLLVVHGTADRGVLPYHSEKLYEAAPGSKDIWRIEGARHLKVFDDEAHRAGLVAYLSAAVNGS